MISAEQFLDILEQKDLLPGEFIRILRQRVAESIKPVTAVGVARQLIKMGHLTPALAERLLAAPLIAQATSGLADADAEDELDLASLDADDQGKKAQAPKPPQKQPEEDELGLAPLEEDQAHARRKEAKKGPGEEDELGLAPLEDDKKKEGKKKEPKRKQSELVPLGRKEKKESELVPLGRKEEREPELAPLEDEPDLAPLEDEEDVQTARPAEKPAPARKPQPQAPKPKQKARPAAPEKPAQKPQQKPARKPQQKPVQKPQQKPVQKPQQKPAQKPQPPAEAPAAPGGGSLLEEELTPLEDAGGLGSLDDLMAGAPLDAATGEALAPVAQKKGLFGIFRRKPRPGKKANVWDSPLLLVGGGTLLLLLIVGGVVLLSLYRETGDKMLEPANEDYRNGSYTQAIYKYDQFLESFPDHRGASLARVRRGLARVRQSAESTRDWSKTLEVAKTVLGEIKTETAFPKAQDELSSLLPDIAGGLAEQARKAPDPALVEQARQALALLGDLPPSLRPKMKIQAIEASLALTERELARDAELRKTIAAIHEALEKGDTAEAYRVRSVLLKQYRDLEANPELGAAVLEISKVQQATVKKVAREQSPQTDELPTPLAGAVTLARPVVAETAVGARGQVVFALAGGSLYGLDGTSGNVLWRRPIGSRSNGRSVCFLPTPVSRTAKSDVLVADTARHEIARLETAAPSKLRWRFPLGQALGAQPAVADGQVLALTCGDQGSRLWTIDVESGKSAGYVHLPQPVRVTPVVDSRRDNVYLVAEHSNLYVLSLADGHCKEVVYLGHQLGSITTKPIAVGRFVLLVDNDKLESSTLRVLSVQTEGEGPSVRQVQQIKLKGHVDTPPLAADRRLALVTDCGAIYVFEVSGTNVEEALSQVAELPAQERRDLVRFSLLESSQFWVAGDQLSKYDIVAARGRLVPKALLNPDEGAVFVQPLVAAGHTLFHARYEIGLPGVLVSAVEMDRGKRLWQTHLAAPPVGEPTLDPASGAVTALTGAGALFRVDAQAFNPAPEQSVVNRALAAVDTAKLRQTLGAVVRLPDGLLAMASAQGAEQVFVLDPGQADPEKQVVSLALPGPLSCAPAEFAGGLLAPCSSGHVFVLDPRTGTKQIEPFQPPLRPGVETHWRDPALVGENALVIADGDRRLYYLGIVEKPARHLAAFATAEVPEPIVSPVAVVGKVAYAVDQAGTLAAFALPEAFLEALPATPPKPLAELARTDVAQLSGRCVWGPRTVGSRVLLATDDAQLLLLDAQQKVLARLALPYGALAGTPLEIDGTFVLASADGVVWRVKPPAGDAPAEELGKVDTGQPLGSGPVLREGRLLVAGRDGNLLEVAMPEPAKSDR